MKCQQFEEFITAFLDGELSGSTLTEFREHQIGCSDCRSLLATVEGAISVCTELPETEPSLEVMSRAIVIPALHPPIDCERFAALVTEFLDGFLEASVYHAFEDHANACASCSDVVSGVALAVTACHSVHFSEELEVPDGLMARILAETTSATLAKQSRATRMLGRVRRVFALYAGPVWAPRFATAAVIVTAFSMLVTNGGLAPSSIYANAARVTSRVYSRSADLAAQTDQVILEVQRIRSDVDEIFEEDGQQKNDTDQQAAPASPNQKGSAGTAHAGAA
ncbi:MAG TPA: zf-HC2 domain-containing protein [Blastocatellia bacterium]|nr:zf-HC2 domain-containing protein [Blastocatellia bacterium]